VSLQEVCLEAEARIRRIQATLIHPQPELLDRCEAELRDVIDLLEPQLAEMPTAPNGSDRVVLTRLRWTVAQLGSQVAHASNLCQGWIQLRLSTGYTAQGQPALTIDQSKATFEI
jgi:hypothetical protein